MIGDAMRKLVDARRLRGRSVAPERLHVRLHWLGDHDNVPQELLRRAKVAGGDVDMAPFGVGFDCNGSLGDASMGVLALIGGAKLADELLRLATLDPPTGGTACSLFERCGACQICRRQDQVPFSKAADRHLVYSITGGNLTHAESRVGGSVPATSSWPCFQPVEPEPSWSVPSLGETETMRPASSLTTRSPSEKKRSSCVTTTTHLPRAFSSGSSRV